MDKKIMQFELDKKSLKMKDILDKEFVEIQVYAISDACPNRNGSCFTLESMKKALSSFANKPILGAWDSTQNDFKSHNSDLKYDKDLESLYYDYTRPGCETPLGTIRESDKIDIVYDEYTKQNWIVVDAVLWSRYAYNQIKKLMRKNGRSKISVEVEVTESHFDENKYEIIDSFEFNGLTILGTENGRPVEEGIENAHLNILELMHNSLFQQKQKALAFAYSALDDYNKNQKVEIPDERFSSDQVSNKETEEDTSIDNEETSEVSMTKKVIQEEGGISAMQMTMRAKIDLLQSALEKALYSNENDGQNDVCVMDFNEDHVYYEFGENKFRCPYNITELEDKQEVKFDLNAQEKVMSSWSVFEEDNSEEKPEDNGHEEESCQTEACETCACDGKEEESCATCAEEETCAAEEQAVCAEEQTTCAEEQTTCAEEDKPCTCAAEEEPKDDNETESCVCAEEENPEDSKEEESCTTCATEEPCTCEAKDETCTCEAQDNTCTCEAQDDACVCEAQEEPHACEAQEESCTCAEETETCESQTCACDEKFERVDPNSEPPTVDVDGLTMGEIIEAASANIKAPKVQTQVEGLGTANAGVAEVLSNVQQAVLTGDPDGTANEDGSPDNPQLIIKQPDDADKERKKQFVSTVEVNGENIDITTLLEKYNELAGKLDAINNSIKMQQATALINFGADFINADEVVDEAAKKEFVSQVEEKCNQFELTTEDEVTKFAKSLMAMYYYEHQAGKNNTKSSDFSMSLNKPARADVKASHTKLKDAINKLNYLNKEE